MITKFILNSKQTNKQKGYSFGYGFVEYVSDDDAQKAIDTFNGYQLEHKRLKVALARPNCEDTKNTNLYIRNIPVTFDEGQLTEVFAQYGEVVQVRYEIFINISMKFELFRSDR